MDELDAAAASESDPNPRYRRRSEELAFDRVAFFIGKYLRVEDV
jgi:hypothetical protein